MKTSPIVIEQTIKASKETVWQAITDREKMKDWYFELDAFRPEVGFSFTFNGKGSKGENYTHLCTVTEVVPYQRLQYSWKYEGYPGDSLVTIELFEEANQTRVKLTHEGLDTFPHDNADFALESFNGGWTELVQKSLKNYAEKNNE